jgi:hypothetical protein
LASRLWRCCCFLPARQAPKAPERHLCSLTALRWGKPIFSDLYSEQTNQLIEAKGSVSRDAIRMAIGQLFDYRRFTPGKTDLTILLPEYPRPDLVELIESAGIGMIYEKNGDFVVAPKK